MLKVDVDCMVRNGKEALVGGVVRQIPDSIDDLTLNQRAYVTVKDKSSDDGADLDFISNVVIDTGLAADSSCESFSTELFKLGDEFNCMTPRVNVCSKHSDWEGCLERIKAD